MEICGGAKVGDLLPEGVLGVSGLLSCARAWCGLSAGGELGRSGIWTVMLFERLRANTFGSVGRCVEELVEFSKCPGRGVISLLGLLTLLARFLIGSSW